MKEWIFKDNDNYKWKVKEEGKDKAFLKTEVTINVFGCTWEMLDDMQKKGLLHFVSVKEV